MTSHDQTATPETLAYFFEDLFLIRRPQATRLYLVRHAQGEDNVSPDAGGDAPLTAVGREQARRLARRLAAQRLDAVYSSPIVRAFETAQAVAAAAGHDVRVIEDLREVELHGFEQAARDGGFDPQELRRAVLERPTWRVFPGAEDRDTMRRRVIGALDGIVAAEPGRRVAVVCHSGVIQALVAQVLSLETDFPFYPFNASITSIRALGRRRALWRLNDIAHLEGMPVGFEGIS